MDAAIEWQDPVSNEPADRERFKFAISRDAHAWLVGYGDGMWRWEVCRGRVETEHGMGLDQDDARQQAEAAMRRAVSA